MFSDIYSKNFYLVKIINLLLRKRSERPSIDKIYSEIPIINQIRKNKVDYSK